MATKETKSPKRASFFEQTGSPIIHKWHVNCSNEQNKIGLQEPSARKKQTKSDTRIEDFFNLSREEISRMTGDIEPVKIVPDISIDDIKHSEEIFMYYHLVTLIHIFDILCKKTELKPFKKRMFQYSFSYKTLLIVICLEHKKQSNETRQPLHKVFQDYFDKYKTNNVVTKPIKFNYDTMTTKNIIKDIFQIMDGFERFFNKGILNETTKIRVGENINQIRNSFRYVYFDMAIWFMHVEAIEYGTSSNKIEDINCGIDSVDIPYVTGNSTVDMAFMREVQLIHPS